MHPYRGHALQNAPGAQTTRPFAIGETIHTIYGSGKIVDIRHGNSGTYPYGTGGIPALFIDVLFAEQPYPVTFNNIRELFYGVSSSLRQPSFY